MNKRPDPELIDDENPEWTPEDIKLGNPLSGINESLRTNFHNWNSATHLKTDEDISLYFDACIDEADGDGSFIAKALGNIARAGGMAQVEKVDMTRMCNPPHPGNVLREWMPAGLSLTHAAANLHVSRVSLSRILNCHAGISADMAIRLSRWLRTSPNLWLGMQVQYDLYQAQKRKLPKILPL